MAESERAQVSALKACSREGRFTISGARNRLDETMRDRGNHRDKPETQGPIGGADFARMRREITGVLDYLSA